ncbi:MAG TPA: hypothetical protein VGD69_19840 [Herpetosiphonaceae bacterium]
MQRRVYQTSRDEWRSCLSKIVAVIIVAAVVIALIVANRDRSAIPPELLGTWELIDSKATSKPSTVWEFAPGSTYIKYTDAVKAGSYYVVDADTLAVTSGCPYGSFARRRFRPNVGCPAELFDFTLEKDTLRLKPSQDATATTETYQRRSR